MKNVEPGFKGYKEMCVDAQCVIDDWRFILTDTGEYGLMPANETIYRDICEDAMKFYMFGMISEPFFHMKLTTDDFNARDMTSEERVDCKAYFSVGAPGLVASDILMAIERL